MRRILFVLCISAACFCHEAKAQWVVTDPGNLAQGIINSAKQIIQTSTTANNTLNGFKETAKVFERKHSINSPFHSKNVILLL